MSGSFPRPGRQVETRLSRRRSILPEGTEVAQARRRLPLPDVIPTSLSYNSTSGNFTSVVSNQGNAATPSGVTVGVAYLVDGVKQTWGFTNTPLAPGASQLSALKAEYTPQPMARTRSQSLPMMPTA